MDLHLKLCTMIIYICNYIMTALGRKLWTFQEGGQGGLTGWGWGWGWGWALFSNFFFWSIF
jgi:hypothetical protein